MATSLPMLHIDAKSNYDAGYCIGRNFKQFFKGTCESKSFDGFLSFYGSDNGREFYEASLRASTKCYPELVEEIRGMAEGAELPFEHVFLNCMASDIMVYHQLVYSGQKKSEDHVELAGCTDVLVNTDDCRLIGHNEDWTDDVENGSYLLNVNIDKSSKRDGHATEKVASSDSTGLIVEDGQQKDCVNVKPGIQHTLAGRNERFIAFAFPCELPGLTYSMSRHFVFTINTLVPLQSNRGGVPVDILLRAMLRCETIEEIMAVMKNEPVGCTYGININIASIHTKDMWSLEVYINEGQTMADLHTVAPECQQQYVHTNHYLHTLDAKEATMTKGSKARKETAGNCPVPHNVKELAKILGDTSSTIEPIYRRPGKSYYSSSVTVATAIFDLNAQLLYVYRSNPSHAREPCALIPFLTPE